MKFGAELIALMAPTRVLRASINVGNRILAGMDKDGRPTGVSVDLACELARQLGVAIELNVFDSAGKSVEAVTSGQLDVGFFAIDPLRGQGLSFSAAYVLIEGAYMVPDASTITSREMVDQPGQRVVVGKGSAYDLYLTRELKAADIVRVPPQRVLDELIQQGLEVAAGVKQQFEMDIHGASGLRMLPGSFMVIQQAMGLPKGRGKLAAQALGAFVEEMKASGFVAQSLLRHGIKGASVAAATEG